MHPRPAPTFGRRAPAAAAPAPVPAHAAPARAAPGPIALGPAAERFRASLETVPSPPLDDFARWKRGRTAGRLGAWVATFALLSPGVICFVVQAPNAVSTMVEVLGIGANWWLRRRRQAHLAAIRAWEPPGG